MTFINYQAWIHFADSILEEALYAEFERQGLMQPLIVFDSDGHSCRDMDRVMSGIPARRKVDTWDVDEGSTLQHQANDKPHDKTFHDGIIGFGSYRALSTAQDLATNAGSSQYGKDADPLAILIPKTAGLPLGVLQARRGVRGLSYQHGGTPRILAICDPTLTTGASRRDTANGAVLALARCIEALIGPAYHPPSTGVAFDGLLRIVEHLPPALDDAETLTHRRELMAGSLNAALATEHGLGTVETLALALADEAKGDPAPMCRILLPMLVASFEHADALRNQTKLRRALGLDETHRISHGLEVFLSKLPLPSHFEALDTSPIRVVETLTQGPVANLLQPNILECYIDLIQAPHPVH